MLHWGVYFIVISNVFVQLGSIIILGASINQIVIGILFLFALTGKLLRRAGIYKLDLLDILLVLFGFYLVPVAEYKSNRIVGILR